MSFPGACILVMLVLCGYFTYGVFGSVMVASFFLMGYIFAPYLR